ncbi:hypothetical protein FACS189413_19340 [Bacteroidia bacterium]|nr:hypothetical protein FACS189413_19340 [Bacteroidia bacterium]
MALSSCNEPGDDNGTGGNSIPWGEIKGNLNQVWDISRQPQTVAVSDNALAQVLLPTLINMLNTIPEAEAYLFNENKSYSQYWTSEQPNVPETNLYKEDGTYVLNGKNLTLTYTDGQTGEIKTSEYQIVSLSDTQLVLYKDILGMWGSLAAEIIAPFDKLGITPKSAYKIITYTKSE